MRETFIVVVFCSIERIGLIKNAFSSLRNVKLPFPLFSFLISKNVFQPLACLLVDLSFLFFLEKFTQSFSLFLPFLTSILILS